MLLCPMTQISFDVQLKLGMLPRGRKPERKIPRYFMPFRYKEFGIRGVLKRSTRERKVIDRFKKVWSGGRQCCYRMLQS